MPKLGSMTRKTVVKPLGYVTTPNPYGQFPAGALRDAKNVVLRRPGEIMAAPAGTNYTQLANNNDRVRLLAPLDAGHLFSFTEDSGNAWSIQESTPGGSVNAGVFPSFYYGTTYCSPSRITATRSRDRIIVNTLLGCMVGDSMQPSSTAQRTFRGAGIPQPNFFLSNNSLTAGGAIPNNIAVAYTVVITREGTDGYILKSVPAPPVRFLNTSGGTSTYTFQIDFVSNLWSYAAGDFVELYRTDGLSTTSATADPGATFKLVSRVALTSTDITNQFVVIVDSQAMLAPYYTTDGRQLYTNPYQEGPNAANRQPDICKTMATFKGFTFYGHLTERPVWEFSVPAGIGLAADNAPGTPRRQYGLGIRNVTGTITNGSAVITGIAASNIVGIVPGQTFQGTLGPFPFGTSVSSVGASTITMSAAATSGGTNIDLFDNLEVQGVGITVSSCYSISNGYARYEITTNKTVSFAGAGDVPGTVFTFEPLIPAGSGLLGNANLTVRATNGQNYSPPIPAITATVKTFTQTTTANLLRWSKDSEPEHVPDTNETQVGSGAIISMVTTKDALWIACTDGVYRLSGDAGVWRVDLVAPGLVLCAPRCMVNMREVIYAYTNFGFGSITDSGFTPISHKVVRLSYPGVPFSETADMLLGRNDAEGEILFSSSASSSANLIYVFNALTGQFSYINAPTQHFAQVTAWAWQENPASGSQCLLWGLSESGVKPAYMCWNSTTAYLDMQVAFYNIDAGDPASMKQWIDVSYLFFDEAAGYTLNATMLVNQATNVYASGIPITLHSEADAACTVGIPRQFALAPVIKPGFQISNITSNRVFCHGISLRYVPLSLQREMRQ